MSSYKALYILPLILFIVPSVLTYQGLYTHHLDDDVSLIVPRKVNHRGEILSHELTHHHAHEQDVLRTDNGRWRSRRSTVENNPSQQLHYHLDIDGETHHLELEPSTATFVAPLMVIERHRRDVRTRVRPPPRHINCHYQGQIRGHDQSRVALSACNGLVSGWVAFCRGRQRVTQLHSQRQPQQCSIFRLSAGLREEPFGGICQASLFNSFFTSQGATHRWNDRSSFGQTVNTHDAA
uniref:Peptidase M12B propeptide domain-containing protein n=1 Tax=Anopheles culicifacies TaxID=139723 RepID=A0A182MTT4_9DIPT